MKKVIFLLLMGCFLTPKAFADENTVQTERVFYGVKARNSYTNPCKGATLQTCGIVRQKLEAISENTTKVERTLEDEDNNVIITDVQIVNMSLQDVIRNWDDLFTKDESIGIMP